MLRKVRSSNCSIVSAALTLDRGDSVRLVKSLFCGVIFTEPPALGEVTLIFEVVPFCNGCSVGVEVDLVGFASGMVADGADCAISGIGEAEDDCCGSLCV